MRSFSAGIVVAMCEDIERVRDNAGSASRLMVGLRGACGLGITYMRETDLFSVIDSVDGIVLCINSMVA